MKALLRPLWHRIIAARNRRVNKFDFNATYPRWVSNLSRTYDRDRAMHLAIGGDWEAIGAIEVEIVKLFGLAPDGYLIDVGCGSGRLAKPLSAYLKGKYLGTDVVPALVDYARETVNRPDWRFEVGRGLAIPEQDGAADMVCFFSVLTHLLHEQSYVYLQEAKRVLKPGGRIVFSFVEFAVPETWHLFEGMIDDLTTNTQPLNMFMSTEAVTAWAEHLGLRIVAIHRGGEQFVPLSQPVVFENGDRYETMAGMGQSVCVLEK